MGTRSANQSREQLGASLTPRCALWTVNAEEPALRSWSQFRQKTPWRHCRVSAMCSLKEVFLVCQGLSQLYPVVDTWHLHALNVHRVMESNGAMGSATGEEDHVSSTQPNPPSP